MNNYVKNKEIRLVQLDIHKLIDSGYITYESGMKLVKDLQKFKDIPE